MLLAQNVLIKQSLWTLDLHFFFLIFLKNYMKSERKHMKHFDAPTFRALIFCRNVNLTSNRSLLRSLVRRNTRNALMHSLSDHNNSNYFFPMKNNGWTVSALKFTKGFRVYRFMNGPNKDRFDIRFTFR